MKEEILDMYFNKQMKPIEIAEKLNIPKYTITRALQKDDRYSREKQRRKEINEIKHINNTKDYIKKHRREQQFKEKNDDLILKHMHNQASSELSTSKRLSNLSYRNWNVSAYKYNEKKKRYEFKKELGRSSDVPKYIKVEVL